MVSISDTGELRVEWQPGGHISDYDPDWLRAHRGGAGDRSRCGPALATWGAELSNAMPGADYADVKGSDDALTTWLCLSCLSVALRHEQGMFSICFLYGGHGYGVQGGIAGARIE